MSKNPEITQTIGKMVECLHSMEQHLDAICPALGTQSVLHVDHFHTQINFGAF